MGVWRYTGWAHRVRRGSVCKEGAWQPAG
jgi:hypothetical protein